MQTMIFGCNFIKKKAYLIYLYDFIKFHNTCKNLFMLFKITQLKNVVKSVSYLNDIYS